MNMADDYEHSIFVSYRWLTERWRSWVSTILIPALEDIAKPTKLDLDRRPIWWDAREQKPGIKWPPELARKLARSQFMVALLCEQYFVEGSWCVWEYESMRMREAAMTHINNPGTCGLIIPIIIQDGDDLPEDVNHRSPIDLVKPKLANPYMVKGTPSHAQLFEVLSDALSKQLVACANAAPAFNPYWEQQAIGDINIRIERRSAAVQDTLPTLKPKATQAEDRPNGNAEPGA